jgi:hypothetical protein
MIIWLTLAIHPLYQQQCISVPYLVEPCSDQTYTLCIELSPALSATFKRVPQVLEHGEGKAGAVKFMKHEVPHQPEEGKRQTTA